MIDPLKKLEVNVVHLYHPNVRSLEGTTIAHVTDLHVGPWVRPRHVERIVSIVNDRNVDIVALTGDYVGYRARTFAECVGELKKLHAPTYAVLGNHDHWASTDIAVETFKGSGITLLRNAHTTVSTENGDFQLVGVDDAVTKNDDVHAAHRLTESDDFVLTLNHVPELANACIEHGADVVLSGHTHGLQFNLRGADRVARRFGMEYIAGGFVIDDGLLYVSRGLGSASWPRRIRANPEIVIYQLYHSERPAFKQVSSQGQR